jgi:hypothetical protein
MTPWTRMTRKYGKEHGVSSLYWLDITPSIPLHCLIGFSQPENIGFGKNNPMSGNLITPTGNSI